jgi:streptogramin lyase
LRRGHLIAIAFAYLIAFVLVGCGGSHGTGNIEGRNGEQGAATNEETTTSEGDRQEAGAAQKPAGLDVKVVSQSKAYVPAGFGDGSLWATELPTCGDTFSATASGGSASATADACALPQNTRLKRLDPRTGEVVADVPLEGFSANITEAAFGAASLWVSSGDYYPEPAGGKRPGDVVLRIDPRTNRVVDRIPVYTASGLAFGHGSVWVTSATYGTLSRIDPQTGEVVAKIEVGRGAVDVAADERSGAVWVAGLYLPKDYGRYDIPEHSPDNKLTRVDSETNRVVAQIPIRADSPDGGASSVAVGEGAVWAQSVDGRLFKVDPESDEVSAEVSVGDYSSHLAVYGGAVWATFQFSCEATSQASASAPRPPSCTRSWSEYDQEHLARVDPRSERVVASEEIGPVSRVGLGRLVAGGGYIWFANGGGLARVAP